MTTLKPTTPVIVVAASIALIAGMTGYAVIISEQTKAGAIARAEASAKASAEAEQARLKAEAETQTGPVESSQSNVVASTQINEAAWIVAHAFCLAQVTTMTREQLSRRVSIDFRKKNLPPSLLGDQSVDAAAQKILLKNGCIHILDIGT